MARPAKTVDVLQAEGKSHRTKAEIERRREGEAALATGEKLKERSEVKTSPVAHREFLRLNKLLRAIEKNDALYEPIINRYCQLMAECAEFVSKRELFAENLKSLSENDEIKPETRYRLEVQMQKSVLDLDKQVQAKRRMMFDIEKECAMTISAAMRSIPKTGEKKINPLLEALTNGDDN